MIIMIQTSNGGEIGCGGIMLGRMQAGNIGKQVVMIARRECCSKGSGIAFCGSRLLLMLKDGLECTVHEGLC